jgi:3-oxoacyl-[acyl-carrier-protein] synthase III
MNIESAKFVHPRSKMTNDDVVEVIREHSAPIFDGDLDRALDLIRQMLDGTSLKTRYWMKDESPLELMCQAAHAAMNEANVTAKDIDLLVFCGIGRGFLEPGDSYFVAQALGMDSVDCFDILDACMAWSRACDVVEAFFRAGRYRRALVVNAESYFVDGGLSYPSNFALRSYRQIEYSFGAFCGGDGATATILSAGGEPWERHYMSTKRGADLCTVPLPGWQGRCGTSKHVGHNGLGAFTSYGSKVFESYRYMIDILKRITPRLGDLSMIFAHTGGDVSSYERWAVEAGCGGKVRYLYPDYGNIGSASMPASIAVHAETGLLTRGDRAAGWIGSSGMSFSTYVFQY